MNLFKKLFKKERGDELIGIWQTTNEVGFHIVMGSELVLNADGTGSEYSWGHGEDEPYEYRYELLWQRKSATTIAIKNVDEAHFTDVVYKMETYIGSYNMRYDMIYEPGQKMEKWNMQAFWIIPGALYRKK